MSATGFRDFVIPAEPDGWRDRAVCVDEDSELFFPIGTTGPALLQIDQAKAVCARCPVVDECLDWALATDTRDGVWGGKSEQERLALKRRRAGRRRPRVVKPPETHCSEEHPLSGDNLFINENGLRGCKACRARQRAESDARIRDRKRVSA